MLKNNKNNTGPKFDLCGISEERLINCNYWCAQSVLYKIQTKEIFLRTIS